VPKERESEGIEVTEQVEEVMTVSDAASDESVALEETPIRGSHLFWRVAVFAGLSVVLAIVFRHCLGDLWQLSRADATYSHMPLIPLVSACLLFSTRERIASAARSAFLPGLAIIGLGVLLLFASAHLIGASVPMDRLSFNSLAGLIIWLGGFMALFGVRSFRVASFPLLFLIFLVPIPTFLLREIIRALQVASTEIAHGLFLLIGVPFLRNDFVFELPGMSVMVAEACSGIRSSISLFITGIIAAHIGLTTPWRRGLLILSVFPITVFKNALRVITLSLLGAYVDPRILDSQLHRAGGIPFFGLALVIFGGVFWVLRRSEVKTLRGGQS